MEVGLFSTAFPLFVLFFHCSSTGNKVEIQKKTNFRFVWLRLLTHLIFSFRWIWILFLHKTKTVILYLLLDLHHECRYKFLSVTKTMFVFIENFLSYLYVSVTNQGWVVHVEILISAFHASRQAGCLSLSFFTSLIQLLFLTCCHTANLPIYCHYAN